MFYSIFLSVVLLSQPDYGSYLDKKISLERRNQYQSSKITSLHESRQTKGKILVCLDWEFKHDLTIWPDDIEVIGWAFYKVEVTETGRHRTGRQLQVWFDNAPGGAGFSIYD